MKTNTVQKATLAIAATALVLVVVGFFAVAPAVAAQTSPNTTTSTTGTQSQSRSGGLMGGAMGHGRMIGGAGFAANQVNISVGQTFTITSTAGKYILSSNHSTNGTASGSLTFAVTGKMAAGYTLSIKSGSLTVAGTTYTVTSGTAQMGRDAAGIVGQGSTNPTGTFLLRAGAHGSFVGSTGTVTLDLQTGSSEYLVLLAGNISS